MIEKGSSVHSAGSGDPALDRRYAWAEAAFRDGDAAAAAEILDQTIAQAPRFVAAWHLFGRAQEALGHREDAATAWRECLALDPQDHVGAALDLARIGALPAEQATSARFTGTLFDGYAERFDDHLTRALGYCGPALLTDALQRATAAAGRPCRFATVYDLGCGTGLMGEAIRTQSGFLAGCDLSARMIARARAKTRAEGGPLYDKLAVAGLTAFLAGRPERSADLVVAADVFAYLGDLRPAFAQGARVLPAGGLLAFSVQSHEGDGVIVGADRRFAHAPAWLDAALAEAGLIPVLSEAASIRRDRDRPVPGLLIVARRG